MIDVIKNACKNGILTEDLKSSDKNIEILGNRLKEKIDKKFKRSFFIREVDSGSCNGCEVEINALSNPYYNLDRFGISFVPSPKFADALMITGAMTKNMKDAVLNAYEITPNPKYIIAVGDCTKGGGVFCNSYATCNGVFDLLPVDIFIPGCPPEPINIINGLLKLLDREAKSLNNSK